jgi:F0F1-type ATP synthase membrane subunit b/b'
MKGALAIILVVMFLSTAASAEDNSWAPGKDENLKWKEYDKEFPEHEKAGKPVFFYFFTDKSEGLCRHFELELFANGSVKGKTGSFLCFKLNSDSAMADQVKVANDTAAVVLLDFQNQELARITGSIEAKEFASTLENASKTNEERRKLLKVVQKAVKDADKYLKAGRYEEAYRIWEALAGKKGEIISPELDNAVAEYEKLLKESEKEVDAAVSRANQLASQCTSMAEYLNRLNGQQPSQQTNQQIDELSTETNKAIYKLNEVNKKYPFEKTKAKTKDAQQKISKAANDLAAAKKRLSGGDKQKSGGTKP